MTLTAVSLTFAEERDLVFRSEDGWKLHATLHLPVSASKDRPVAGVPLLPSPKRERQVFGQYAIPGLGIGLEKQNMALAISFDQTGEVLPPKSFYITHHIQDQVLKILASITELEPLSDKLKATASAA